MDTLWNNLVKGLQEGALSAADKARDLTRIARARLDIAAAKNQLNRTKAQLGATVHDLLEAGADPATDAQVQVLCQQLKTLDAELVSYEASYGALQIELAAVTEQPDKIAKAERTDQELM
ncbi:MAG: hypothetical protein VX893_06405 [Candidatus Latescibacterota bacterium]|nr:hypothetical protein [Candidatus Latescibacterota bacterium]